VEEREGKWRREEEERVRREIKETPSFLSLPPPASPLLRYLSSLYLLSLFLSSVSFFIFYLLFLTLLLLLR